jgi:secreted trypsin-like serine protease
MKTLMLTLFAGSMAACAVDGADGLDEDAVATDEQSIIGGTVDNGDPSVVAIFAHAPGATSGSLCSGTVVSSRTVLTAAHCVDPRVVGSGLVFEVLTGTSLSGAPSLAVSSTAFDPGFDVNNLGAGHDIGVVRLAQATTLRPIAINRSHTLNTRASVKLVGYGTNTHSNTGAGTKRTVTTSITAQNALLVQIGNSNRQTCHGDSGGPAFQTLNGVQTIIGVTSFGSDNSETSVCFGGGVDTRVDAVLAFIDSHL